MQEQIELIFYVKGRLLPITRLIFENKDSCEKFVDSMQMKDFIVCSDIIIPSKEIKYVKIR